MGATKTMQWDSQVERRGSHAIKWDAMEQFVGAKDLAPFWVADMDFESAEAIVEALTQRAKHGVYGYTGDDEGALEAFVKWMAKRHETHVEKQWIKKSPGMVTAIGLSIQAFTNPGDGIVIQTPVYPQFIEMIQVNERRLIENPIAFEKGRAQIDFEDLAHKFKSEKPKMMILCSPHNPLGRVWSQADLLKILALCVQHEVLLFADEIHADLTFSGVTFHSVLGAYQKALAAFRREEAPLEAVLEDETRVYRYLVSATAPSKTFNIAGLFYSLVYTPSEENRLALQKKMDSIHLTAVNCFNETAAKVAYEKGEAWLEELLPYLEGNYEALVKVISEVLPEVKVAPMEGTYLAWLDFRALIPNGYELKRFMIDQAKVAVNDGRAFGNGGEGFVRFNFGCPRHLIQEGIIQIAEAWRRRGNA